MTISVRWVTAGFAGLAVAACDAPSGQSDEATAPEPVVITIPETEATRYVVLVGGTPIGAANITHDGNDIAIEYEFRNNGRGPTLNEQITLNDAGYPVSWTIQGSSTFGNLIDEMFAIEDGVASWRDSTGSGSTDLGEARFYVDQNGSPWSLALLARALLAEVWPLYTRGDMQAEVFAQFPLADAPDAHELMESSRHIGKILLEVDGTPA